MFGNRDWNALEKQLSETRELLRNILEHLNEVLRNLRRTGDTFRKPSGAEAKPRPKTPGPETRGAQSAQSGAKKPSANPYTHTFFKNQRPTEDNFRKTYQQPGWQKRTQTTPGSEGHGQKSHSGASSQSSSHAGREQNAQAGSRPGAEERFQKKEQSFNSKQSSSRESAGSQQSQHRGSRFSQGAEGRRKEQREYRPPVFGQDMTLGRAYSILCLSYPCTAGEIKAAYRVKARQFHPDLGGDEEKMKSLNLAYELAMQCCPKSRQTGV